MDRAAPDPGAPDRQTNESQPAESDLGPVSRMPAVLRLRADFLRAASARRISAAGFLLQGRQRDPTDGIGDGVRVGYTCSKKIGNAVTRNRAKRRLRALAAEVVPALGRPGWDYVLVGKPDVTVTRVFADLREDLMAAMGRIHDAPIAGPRQPRKGKGAAKGGGK
ncbi:MAG: ribonuclease P protein component [Paracoccus denitrificans]|nr:MAG: ribonuclease P protein component [Paracoccus denitrificans]PZO83898.1 MAG: ribonuclease P protein component [Paracoccus denitrificans]